MSASVLLHLIVYAAIAVFALVVIIRFFRMQSMPLHLRWELYPVGHEIGDKARYGGSNLEEVDWWTKPIEKSKVNELRAMVPEILFLIALFENNRKTLVGLVPVSLWIVYLGGIHRTAGVWLPFTIGGCNGRRERFVHRIRCLLLDSNRRCLRSDSRVSRRGRTALTAVFSIRN